MADDTRHAAVVESLKATASELHARPPEDMNQDWADRMAEALGAAGLLAAPAAQPAINVTVDREANAAYVRVAEGVVFRTAEINNSVNADYDRSAQLLGVEILDLPMAPAAPADDEASREALLAERAAWDQRLSDVQAEYLKREESWDRTRERLTRQRAELLWLHAEAVWQRDQARERADKRLVKYVAVADELDRLRASAVVLPEDWRQQIDAEVGTWGYRSTKPLAELIESWRPATVEAAPARTFTVVSGGDGGPGMRDINAAFAQHVPEDGAEDDRDTVVDVLTDADEDLHNERGGDGALMNRNYLEYLADRLLARYDIRERGETQVEPDGAALIASKRHAVTAKGWTPEHDDRHVHGELLDAARCYADQGRTWFPEFTYKHGTDDDSMSDQDWPWWAGDVIEGWYPSRDPIENLANAGQLIAAEIDRLRRAAGAS